MKRLLIVLFMIECLIQSYSAFAGENHQHKKVVPDTERHKASDQGFSGPAKSEDIDSIVVLGKVKLDKEFPELVNRQLRAREITVLPGGVVAVHQHDTRPGLAYILEGEIIEHRNDSAEPILRKPGAIAFEKTGVVHWWENKSDTPVKALVVDIFKTDTQ